MDVVTAGTLVAVLKYSKIPDAVLHLVEKLLGPLADAKGKELLEARSRRLARKLARSHEILDRRGYTSDEFQTPRPAVLIPTFENASLIDDDVEPELAEMWSGLLASEAVGHVPPGFPLILAELSPSQAKIMEVCWQSTDHTRVIGVEWVDDHHGLVWDAVSVAAAAGVEWTTHDGRGMAPDGAWDAMQLLKARGLIEFITPRPDGTHRVSVKINSIALTRVGRMLMEACHGPAPKAKAQRSGGMGSQPLSGVAAESRSPE